MYKYFGLNTKEQTIDDNVPGSLKELLENNLGYAKIYAQWLSATLVQHS
jgi:hypothetical protein